MGRPRLTPEERQERRRERSRRSFSDESYRHYDPATEGYGSAEEWIGTAEAVLQRKPPAKVDADLDLLGLKAMPGDRKELHRAFRLASTKAHPDAGGSNEAFLAITTAYERLMKRILTPRTRAR